MAVAVNGSITAANSSAIVGALTGGVATTFAFTVPAGTTCLVLMEGNTATSGTSTLPTAVTYNGVSLTNVSGSLSVEAITPEGVSIWYLLSPPTGSSLTVSVTYTATIQEQCMILIPLTGVSLATPVGTPAIATASTTSSAVTATGGGSQDLYLGCMQSQNTTSTPGGGQTNLTTKTSRGTTILSADSIPGSSSGAFSWTVAAVPWVNSAVAFLAGGAGGGTASIAWVT
jgi:hypothetical protein